jgi:DNA-binding IscR family transcriptional regulator
MHKVHTIDIQIIIYSPLADKRGKTNAACVLTRDNWCKLLAAFDNYLSENLYQNLLKGNRNVSKLKICQP